MSATMIERVARAIHDAGKAPWEPLWHEFGGLDRNLKQRALAAARAAIAEMRKPSEHAVCAGDEAAIEVLNDMLGVLKEPTLARKVFVAVIDAALGEDPS